MPRHAVRLFLALGAGLLAFVAATAAPDEAPKAPPPPAPGPRKPPTPGEKAEEHFKNIQALKGVPADELVPAMQFISASLGVECEYCHVERKPEADDKKEKLTARKMIAMTQAIDRDHFEGKREVTCMSCHRGATRPVAIPAVASEAEREEEPSEAAAPALPEVASVLDAYVKAIGGAEAIGRVESRVQTGHLSGFGPEPFPVEIYAKAPNRRISIVKTPRGESVTAYDGTSGWLGGGGRPPQDMSVAESKAARLDADLRFPTDVRDLFTDVRVVPSETIDGKKTVRVVARKEGDPPVELFFDPESGLLVRTKRYVATPLGRLPTQIDYADYRDAEGVKIPFRWTVARPSGRFTIQIDETKLNVPVDDARFRKGS